MSIRSKVSIALIDLGLSLFPKEQCTQVYIFNLILKYRGEKIPVAISDNETFFPNKMSDERKEYLMKIMDFSLGNAVEESEW